MLKTLNLSLVTVPMEDNFKKYSGGSYRVNYTQLNICIYLGIYLYATFN